MAETLASKNKRRWGACKVHPSKIALFDKVAKRLTAPAAVARYKAVEKRTGVPWWFIAVTHERESSQNWSRSLAQGDPWNRVSTHVPKGRGPFNSWEDAAYDALVKCHPFAAKNKDWSIGGALAMLEKYNGLGYASKGLPSPYIWAGTNQYVRGKYVADGVFDPNHVDTQLGCAGLLMRMNVFGKPTSKPVAGTNTVVTGTMAAGAATYFGLSLPWIIGIGIGVATIIGLAFYLNHLGKKSNV
jgi:lysozyme family protein